MKYFSTQHITNTFVIVATFILFVIATFTKGVTHDILLEAGVFLVSVKLILSTYWIRCDLREVQKGIEELKNKK